MDLKKGVKRDEFQYQGSSLTSYLQKALFRKKSSFHRNYVFSVLYIYNFEHVDLKKGVKRDDFQYLGFLLLIEL